MVRPIGGYFELELRKGAHFHSGALALNSARSCLGVILKNKMIKRILLPYYICDVVLEPLSKYDVQYDYYPIDEMLDPVLKDCNTEDSVLLYVNYFGLKQGTVKRLSEQFKNIIIDNAQAFFAKPLKNVDTYYSSRKFFGVPDGGYLYSDINYSGDLEQDFSMERITHLIKRLEQGPEAGFEDYLANESSLLGQSEKKMSRLTSAILANIQYEEIIEKRNNNFRYLHQCLQGSNLLKVDCCSLNGPMIYPYLSDDNTLREFLISKKVFVATYWRSVLAIAELNSFEHKLARNLLPLPIDQRYGEEEMQNIVKIITSR